MLREREYADTGYAPIDEEHRKVSALLRALVEAVNSGRRAEVETSLRAVIRAVAAHFAHEERLMKETAFASFARHKEAHDAFIADAKRFAKELEESGITGKFRRWAVGRLLECFRFHVMAYDVALGKHLQEQPSIAPRSA
jgi:hemerythrin-like metal-binding protein